MKQDTTPTAISAVCITVGDDHSMRTILGESGPSGSVFVGESHTGGVVQFHGTVDQLRSLAAALYDGANDLAAQETERTDADIDRERVLAHYTAELDAAKSQVSA